MIRSQMSSVKSFFIKFITSAIILALTAFFTPYFEINAFFSLMIAAFIITIIDYIFNLLLDNTNSTIVRGVIGFLISITILYGTQFIIPNYIISLPSAIIGSIIYSIIASHVPSNDEKAEKKASQDSTTS